MPKTALKDRLFGRATLETNPGLVPYLTSEEEDELVKYLLMCAEIGYLKTKQEILAIVRQAVQKKRREDAVKEYKRKGWWNRFVERWPAIRL